MLLRNLSRREPAPIKIKRLIIVLFISFIVGCVSVWDMNHPYGNLDLPDAEFSSDFHPSRPFPVRVKMPVIEKGINDEQFPAEEIQKSFHTALLKALSVEPEIYVATAAIEPRIKYNYYHLDTKITTLDCGSKLTRAVWVSTCVAEIEGQIIDPETHEAVFRFAGNKTGKIWDGSSPMVVDAQNYLDELASAIGQTLARRIREKR
ncbi:MAG TPA: hypothetical protein VJA17_05585 [Candidatus Omnitrophota bacterium]|nr:hypothetical protein [Candidatus Omnitrophota bacterium]